LVDSVRKLARNLAAHHAFTAAAAMAFHFFLSLIPLLVLGGAVLGLLVRQRGVEPLMEPILEALPAEAADLVRRQLEGLGGAVSVPVAPLGVAGFVLVASTGTHHMMDVFEVAAGAPRRKWWKQRAIALAWNLGMATALSLSAWALLKADHALHRDERAAIQAKHAAGAPRAAASSKPHDPKAPSADAKRPASSRIRHASWERVVATATLLAIAFVGLGAFYAVAVDEQAPSPSSARARKRRSRPVWRGAALALSVGFLVSYLFGLYAGTLGSYAAYYGSLAAVAVILVWLFLTSLALLMGAELNAAGER